MQTLITPPFRQLFLAISITARVIWRFAGRRAVLPRRCGRSKRRGLDVALVDLTLASGSGLELIKDLRICCPEIVLVVLSMHEESTYAERALRAGARGYVMKREATKKVISALRQVLDRGIFVSDSYARAMTKKQIDFHTPKTGSLINTHSDRELQVFEMLGTGAETREIALSLNIALKIVQTHRARMKEKLGVGSLNELMREAILWVETERPT